MRSLLSSMMVAAALAALTGCGGNVVVGSSGGGNGSGGNGGNGGDGGGIVDPTGGPQPTSPGHAIALGSDDITLRFSNQPLACDNQGVTPTGCSWWSVDIGLPDFLFVPGSIDFESANAKLFIQETGEPSSPNQNDCPGAAGGGTLPATLIIHSVSATEAELELQGFNTLFTAAKPDGFYTAPRCN